MQVGVIAALFNKGWMPIAVSRSFYQGILSAAPMPYILECVCHGGHPTCIISPPLQPSLRGNLDSLS